MSGRLQARPTGEPVAAGIHWEVQGRPHPRGCLRRAWLLLQLFPLLPWAEKLVFGAGLFSLTPRGMSSHWVQVAGTAGTDGPSPGPSASSHTPVWKVALAWPYRSFFLEETQSQCWDRVP